MNHIYRSVWNDALGCVVAISEIGMAGGKRSSTIGGEIRACQDFALRALSVSLLLGFATTAHALPSAGVVSSGSATITSSGPGSLLITQSSQNALLNWQSFGIGAAESVRFAQPGSNSVAINRVLGSDPSQILGSLSANGKVFLVNPNGIMFGKGASVNVGGLVASALDLADADFTAGRYRFSGTGGGEVTNLGSIQAEQGGSLALLGARVSNEGTISANLGSVALAAGSAATVDVPIDGLIHVTVDKSAATALASNGGLIQADGGEVLITAHAKDALLNTVVNNQGIVQANSVGFRNGRIVLDGADSGVVNVGGTLRASGLASTATGGTLIASGDKILIADHAQLDATGASGGGGIYVGGGWQGRDPDIRQASGVYVAQSATLDASATVNGNGGTVVTWSDVHNPQSATRIYGSLNARGGAEGGDGGRIETSGHWLDVSGLKADAAAPRGKGGVWLLDPTDLTVSAAPTDLGTVGPPPGFFTSVDLPLATNVQNTDIQTLLNGGTSVVLQVSPAGGGNGDIFVNAPIATAPVSNTSLTLTAFRDVVLNASIANPGPSVGKLDVNLLAGRNFINNVGAAVLSLPGGGGGQWVILSSDPATNTFGGLTSGNKAIWGGGPAPLAGNWYVFGTTGAVTATTVSDAKTYGQSISVAGDITYSGLPLTSAATYGNVYLNLAVTDALSALPAAGSAGESSTASVGGYAISAGGGAPNPGYTLSIVNSGTLSVGKASLTVTANNASRLYGDPNPVLSATVSGFVNGETVGTAAGFGGSANVSTTATPTTGVGSVAITPTVGTLTASNYNFTTLQNGTLTIGPAPLTVTANPDTKTYNGVAYSGGNGVAYAGFVNSETSAVLSGTLSYAGTSQGAKNVGSYVMSPGGLSSTNYAVSFVDGLLTITPAGLSAIVASLTGTTSKVYDGTTAATLTPGNFSVSGFATGEGASVTKTSGTYDTAGAGTNKTVTVSLNTSDYAANGGTLLSNYTLPTTVSGAIGTISKAPLTVTANNATRLYGAANPALSAAVSGFVNGETSLTAAGFGGSASVSTTATGTTGVGSVAITPTAGTLTASNYNFTTLQNGTLTITKAPLTVTANADTKTYNGVAYSGGNGVTYAGFVNAETASVLGGALAFGGSSQGAINAGQYEISANGLTSSNYAIDYLGSTLTVKPKSVSVTGLAADNKEFDGTPTVFIRDWGTVVTGVGSETLALNHGSAAFSDSIVGTGKTVTAEGYSLANGTQGGLASNYVLTSTSAQTLANIVVGERAQSVSAVQSSLSTSTPSFSSAPGSSVPGTSTGANAVPLVNLMERERGLDTVAITVNGSRIDGGNPDGLSASQDTVPSSTGGPAGSTSVAGQTAAGGPAAANRVAGQAAATGSNSRNAFGGPVGGTVGGTAGSAVTGAASRTAAPPGTSSFRTSGLSNMPAPAAPVPGTAPGVSQDVYVKGFSRAVEVGTTTGGAVILATVAANANLTRLGVTVAAGDGFGIAVPLDLFGAAAVRGAATVQATTSSGGRLPSWLTFDRSRMRLTADNVPQSGLPLTLKLAAGPGKTVEVTLK